MLGEVNTRILEKYEYDIKLSDRALKSKLGGVYKIDSVMTDDIMKAMTPVAIADGGTYNVVLNFETIPPNKVNSNNETIIAKVLYNKVDIPEAWTIKPDILVGRGRSGGCGAINSALVIGGHISSTAYNNVELYNGYNWSNIAGLVTGIEGHSSVGIYNNAAALCGLKTGSVTYQVTQLYNGSNWYNGATCSRAYNTGGAFGLANDAVIFGGSKSNYASRYTSNSWKNISNMVGTRNWPGGCGIANAGLAISGNTSMIGYACTSYTEIFNGSSWSNTGTLSNGRAYPAATGGINSALSFGGRTSAGITNINESFNGSVWSAKQSAIISRYGQAEAGTGSEALTFAGFITDFMNQYTDTRTEQYTGASLYYTKLDKSQYSDSVFSNWANNDTVIGKLTSSISLDLLGY